MKIQMTGVDHARAPVEIRERFAFTTAAAHAAMEEIRSLPDVAGCVLLCTCNRTELWVCGERDDLPAVLCRSKGLPPEPYGPYFVCREGEQAIRYLFELAAGLQSRILGEDQILGQIKTALDRAREGEFCGSVLDVLFRNAITGGKKVKTELQLSTANASAAELAITRLESGGMELSGKRCLVIGSGEMGKRAAVALQERGASVTVTLRQYRSGNVAVIPGCSRVDYGERYRVIPDCDLVVSATSSPNVTIRWEMLESCGLKRDVCFLDLAVPRDIDPQIADLPHVTLWNIDAFAEGPSAEAAEQIRRAEEILRAQQEKFADWLACRELVPAADAFAAKLTAEPASAGKRMRKLLFAIREIGGDEAVRACIAAMEQMNDA